MDVFGLALFGAAIAALLGVLANWVIKPRWATERPWLVIVAIAVLAVVGGVSAAVQSGAGGLSVAPANPVPDARTANDDLNHEVNPRFGFAYDVPGGWLRMNPDNSDGATFRHPMESAVEIGFYGTTTPFREQIEANPDSMMTVVRVDAARADDVSLEGYRVEELITGPGLDRPRRRIQQWYDLGDHTVGFYAFAPDRDFEQYRQLFHMLLDRVEPGI